MIREEWFALAISGEVRGSKRPVSAQIRVWHPGDGLACAHTTKQRLVACTVPVAVIEVTSQEDGYRGPRVTVRTSSVCKRHVAQAIRDLDGEQNFNLVAEADRVARETVLAAHWDEYQREIKRVRENLAGEAVSALPEVLRDVLGEHILSDVAGEAWALTRQGNE